MKNKWLSVACLLSILLVFGGCKSNKPVEDETPDEYHPGSILMEAETTTIEGGVKAEEWIASQGDKLGEEIHPGIFENAREITVLTPFIGSESTVDEEIYRKLFPNANEKALVQVNISFDGANLADVIPAFAEPLNLNYILDPEISGTVTMSVSAALAPREVWRLFEQILTHAGAYCELGASGILHIKPFSKIARERHIVGGLNIEARIVPLKHVTARSLIPQLTRFVNNENAVTALEPQNALVVVESRDNMARLLQLIDEMDRKAMAGWAHVVLPCRNVSSEKIKAELLEVLPVLGFPVSDGSGKEAEATGIKIMSLERVQAIIASSATIESLEELRRWVQILDRSDTGEQERVFVYEVENDQVETLLQALATIFPVDANVIAAPQGASEGETRDSASGSLNTSISSKQDEEDNTGNVFSTPMRIFADARNNRMLIRTTPRAYAMGKAILERIDTVPDRVLMQLLVVEIELSDSNEFGVEFSSQFSAGNTESIIGTNYEALSPSGAPGQTGGKYFIFNPSNPDQKFAYIRAVAGRNKMKVLSSPQIVANSHMTSKISVGRSVPIVTSDITDTSSVVNDNTSLRRSYQYEDTGIILTITPRTTKGGLVELEIDQILSEAIDNAMKGIDSPIIKKDELKTTLSLRSGRTLILGGLIKEKYSNTHSSLPFIADIPFLRTLTGNTRESVERTEILLLVTANIITEDTRIQDMVRRYSNAVSEIKKFEHKQFGTRRQDENANE